MRILISFVFLFLVSIQSSAQQKEGWNLVFHDEFDSTKLDSTKWRDSYPWGRNICTAGEYTYYTPGKNYKFEKGIFTMYTRKEDVTARAVEYYGDNEMLCDSVRNLRTFHYTSGMIYSQQQFLYGYFEIRFKLSKGKGLWPAFWLYGPDTDEIDIFEMFGNELNKIGTNIHYKNECMCHGKDIVLKKKIFSKTFNTIALEWKPGELIWYLNGDIIRTEKHDFNKPMNLIAGQGVYWAVKYQEKYKAKKMFPATYQIDYIRIYQRKKQE